MAANGYDLTIPKTAITVTAETTVEFSLQLQSNGNVVPLTGEAWAQITYVPGTAPAPEQFAVSIASDTITLRLTAAQTLALVGKWDYSVFYGGAAKADPQLAVLMGQLTVVDPR
jgi:hypothetical protein